MDGGEPIMFTYFKILSLAILPLVGGITLAFLTILHSAAEDGPVLRYTVDTNSGFAPFVLNDPTNPGILAELIILIFKEANIAAVKMEYPEKRGSEMFSGGSIDIEWASPAWFPDGQFPSGSIGTKAILRIREILILPHEQKTRWQNVESIHGNSVGTVLGYTYHDEKMFIRNDVANEETLVRMISLKRLNVAIVGEYTARYWSKKLDVKIAYGPIHSAGDLVFRLQSKYSHLLPQLHAAISKLSKDGIIDAIIEKYIGDPSEKATNE